MFLSMEKDVLCIVLLAQQNKLTLDDDVRQHIPEFPDFGETITIRHLIHHTSGLRGRTGLLYLAGWRLLDLIKREDIMELVYRQKDLNFKSGEKYAYCNTDYTVLAEIIERVSGQTIRDFAREHIFEPLGMTNTHFHNNIWEIVENRAYAYMMKQDRYWLGNPNSEECPGAGTKEICDCASGGINDR